MKVIIIIIITIIFQKCYFLFIGKRIRLLFNECTRLLMYVEGCAVLEKHLRDGEAADHSRTVLPGCYPLTNPCLPQISGWSCLDVGSVGAASIFSAVCACPVQMCPHCGGEKGIKTFFSPKVQLSDLVMICMSVWYKVIPRLQLGLHSRPPRQETKYWQPGILFMH